MRWKARLAALAGAMLVVAPVHAEESAVCVDAEEITLRLLYQSIAILVGTRLVTWVVRRLGQTDVSSEILPGLRLGPSLLGAPTPPGPVWLFWWGYGQRGTVTPLVIVP